MLLNFSEITASVWRFLNTVSIALRDNLLLPLKQLHSLWQILGLSFFNSSFSFDKDYYVKRRSLTNYWGNIWNEISKAFLGILLGSVQSLSHVRLFATPWITASQASLSITHSQSSLKLMSIESVMPSSHLILCHPLRLLPAIPPSIRVFSNELTLRMSWPKPWSFTFSISPSKEIQGLISFRMDWLDCLRIYK